VKGRDSDSAVVSHDPFWDLYSRCYDSVYQLIPYRGLLWDTFQALELEPGMRVLDAGCGTANLELFISEKPHPSIQVNALDFSPHMLKRASRKCAHLDWVDFARADLGATLPFEDSTFDRLVSVNVLYTLEDWDFAFSEFLRVLKPEGRMVLASSAPDFDGGELFRDHIRRIRNIWGFRRRAATVLSNIGTFSTLGLVSGLMNSLVIDRREKRGQYHSPGVDELGEFFDRHRPDGLADFQIGWSMADQDFLSTLTKAVA
jgi:ubiquinone/menaquinone biosynthesis C-methylase UbiE